MVLPRAGLAAYFLMSTRAGLIKVVGSVSDKRDAVPRRRLRPVALVRGRAAVPLRAVFNTLSIVMGRVACVPGLTNPDTGLRSGAACDCWVSGATLNEEAA